LAGVALDAVLADPRRASPAPRPAWTPPGPARTPLGSPRTRLDPAEGQTGAAGTWSGPARRRDGSA
ncbi:hypothetical protein AB0J28_32360, partial [Streptosporangium canum]|uniref:hypothetical protein n=1 Tax=Streptosporangium canum TaxID=324952 RepID=UPI003430C1CD